MKLLALAGPLVLGGALLLAASPTVQPARALAVPRPMVPAAPASVRRAAAPAPPPSPLPSPATVTHGVGQRSVGVARWDWPLAPRPRLLRAFEPPAQDWLPGHRGVDLAGAAGQQVLAAGDGVVGFSGTIAGVGVVTVVHASGLRTTYQPVAPRLAAGRRVRRGDLIGVLSATTTHCPPRTCLHWGLLRGRVYLDPLTLLGYGHPVLLPLTP